MTTEEAEELHQTEKVPTRPGDHNDIRVYGTCLCWCVHYTLLCMCGDPLHNKSHMHVQLKTPPIYHSKDNYHQVSRPVTYMNSTGMSETRSELTHSHTYPHLC